MKCRCVLGSLLAFFGSAVVWAQSVPQINQPLRPESAVPGSHGFTRTGDSCCGSSVDGTLADFNQDGKPHFIRVSLRPAKMDFRDQLIGTSSHIKVARLTNTGDAPVNLSGISVTGLFSQMNNCPTVLYQVGDYCDIAVRFDPSRRGRTVGQLSVFDDAKGSPQTVALSGVGTVVKLSDIGVNFGDQKVGTKSPAVAVRLTNTGKSSLVISNIAVVGGGADNFSQRTGCGEKVPPGGHCTIKVNFKPQSNGQKNAELQISDDGGGSPQKVALAGTGT